MPSLTLESATEKDARLLPRLMPRLHVKAFSGGTIVLIFILMGLFGPALAPHDPNKQELTAMMKAPQGLHSAHVLGTDNLGRDILARIIAPELGAQLGRTVIVERSPLSFLRAGSALTRRGSQQTWRSLSKASRITIWLRATPFLSISSRTFLSIASRTVSYRSRWAPVSSTLRTISVFGGNSLATLSLVRRSRNGDVRRRRGVRR